MRKQPYPVAQLTKGLVTDVDATFLVDQSSPYLRGVQFDNGLVKKALGRTVFGSGLPLTGGVMLISTYVTTGGTTHTLVVTEDYIYLYDPSAGTYSIKNQEANAAPVVLTGTEDDRFSAVSMGKANAGTWYDYYILTNGKDNIQRWDGDSPSTSKFADLGGWGVGNVKARSLAVFQTRLIAGFTIESGTNCPYRVRWSVAGDMEDISGTGSGFADLIETPDWVVGLKIVRSRLFVIKEKSIWELVYVGGTDIFKPTIVVNGIGGKAPHCLCSVGDDLAFFGNNGVFLFNGITPTPLDEAIHSYLFQPDAKIINEKMIHRSVGMYKDTANQVHFVLPKKDSTRPNMEFTYYMNEGTWAVRERETTAFGEYTETSKNTWANGTGTWANQSGNWLTQNIPAGAVTTLLGTANGYVYEDDGLHKSNETMEFQTKDWIFEHAQRWTEIRVQARGANFTLSYSLDEGYTWAENKSFTAANISGEFKEYVMWVNKTSQKLRAKITTTGEDFEVKWIEPWYIPRLRSVAILTS